MTVLTRSVFSCFTFLFFASALLHSFLPLISGFDAYRWFQVSVTILCFSLFAWENLKLFVSVSTVAFLVILNLDAIPYPIIFLFFDIGYWVSALFVALYFLAKGVENSELAKLASVAASVGCILYLPTILMGLGFWYGQGDGRVTEFLPFGFYGIRPWSHLATWLMPLVMGTLATSSALPLFRYRPWKNLLTVTAAFWFAVLLGSGARGSLVAQFFSLLVLFAFFGNKAFPVGRFWMVTFGWGLILYVLLIVLLPTIIFSATEYHSVLRSGTSGRMQLWGAALELSLKNFPLGGGPLSYISETSAGDFGTPHSLYFRWAAEYGWLIVLMFIGGMLWIGLPSWFEFRRAPVKTYDSLHLAIFWSVLAAFTHASVSGVFTSPYSLLVGLPILAVYFGYVFKGRFSYEPVRVKWLGVSVVSAVLFGVLIAMIPPMHDWHEEAKADQSRYVKESHGPLAPRFWLHGRYTGKELKEQEITP
ncbi:O-antigen ligase family protein [Marinobacter sp.]|uniref:O-antigen ligase family protein n=1 Tax=Marinobacter sp. TaxID=50741 RepID=UPI003B52945E